jgi:N-acetylneuraminic acid mutarotase
MLNMRNHPAKPENFRMVATSDDGGRTLTPARPDRALIEPPAQASLLRLTTAAVHDRNRLLFANPASARRERMTVRLSYDEGRTWPVARVVHEGAAAYSSLVAIDDRTIGLLFERGERSPYERITFARLALDWLTDGKDRTASRKAATTELPPVPDPHGLAGAFAGVHERHLLAAGGANFPDRMPWDGGTKVWHDAVFALPLDTPHAGWTRIGRLPEPNAYGVALTTPEGVLIIGGSSARRHFRDVRLMTRSGGRVAFRRLPPLPVPLAQMAAAIVGRRVHVIGGIATPDSTRALTSHYQLDLDALQGGWRTLPPLPAAGRILPIAAALGDAFHVIGGCSLSADGSGRTVRTYLRDSWKFTAGRWIRTADMPRPAAAAASPAPAGKGELLVVGGDDGAQAGVRLPADHQGFPREILRYDSAHDRWRVAGALDRPAPVTLPAVPWQNGFILVSGEIRPGVRTRQVLLLHPAP